MAVINPQKAVDAARTMQKKIKYFFSDLPELHQAMEPLLVERLDNGQKYYIVPFAFENNITLVAEIDAEDASLHSLTQIPRGGSYPLLTSREALNLAHSYFPEYNLGNPRLIWTPCRETASTLYPFYQIAHSGGSLYISMSGHVYSDLSPFGLGD